MIVTIQPYDAWQYSQVFRVLEWRDGCVYRTTPTALYVRDSDGDLPRNFVKAPVSTAMLRQHKIVLTVVTPEELSRA